jgi:hypothetical protein
MFRCGEQAITDVRGCHEDSNQLSTLQGYKPDNTTHVGHGGNTSDNNSRHGQRAGPGPTLP